MHTSALLKALQYSDSPNFLPARNIARATEHAHIFRHAVRSCSVHGVYLLREDPTQPHSTSTPVVYVAEAETTQQADDIHRKVWNQDIVPFLLVRMPTGVRLYSGFKYDHRPRQTRSDRQGVIHALIAFDDVLDKLSDFRAQAIDDGTLFRNRGTEVEQSSRVDWRLLDSLKQLGEWLHKKDLDRKVAHALIGKFVYLRYLRDRRILSDRKLQEWNIDFGRVLGREASLAALQQLIDRVDDWLNGSIFPLPLSGKLAPKVSHIKEVASVFLGDDPNIGQLHLDFAAYDFSHIPIETLSTIYEQFLAIEGHSKDRGAYYTPIPLVNFMLAELNDLQPLEHGMRVLDPACGSGAFLVQCYRRLIEQQIRAKRRPLRPSQLRDLLVKHIYGIDRDPDACRVAALSLVLTMLDYIETPDLVSTPTFKLPDLHNNNIFQGDFFDPNSSWKAACADKKYDWIVGNPPWLRLDSKRAEDTLALEWIDAHRADSPIAGNQVAEAFAWKAATHLAPGGTIALLLPAMTLFKEDTDFRARFFRRMHVCSVANLSNLREVLFAGRARRPAAAFFYMATQHRLLDSSDRAILVYSPLVANQHANRPKGPGARQQTWNLTLNSSELRSLRLDNVVTGHSLPWKLAMWGSTRDERLLTSVERRFPTLAQFAQDRKLVIHQGLELRDTTTTREPLKPLPMLAGKFEFDTMALRNRGRIYAFPPSVLRPISPNRAFIRKRGGEAPLAVCYPPHVIVSAARTFAVFSNDFLVVPPIQVGIAGPVEQDKILRALSLFLSSDFAIYHQFLTSPQWGVRDGFVILEALRRIPTPLADLSEAELQRWLDLHASLVQASLASMIDKEKASEPLFRGIQSSTPAQHLASLEQQVNDAVCDLMKLGETERFLIHDLVHVRMHLSDGQVGEQAIRIPSQSELSQYATTLKAELDEFIDPTLGISHHIAVVHDNHSGMVQIHLGPPKDLFHGHEVHRADEPVARELADIRLKLQRQNGQWLYFNRNLFLYKDGDTFLLKPFQRFLWTRSQALADADEIIAAALAPEEAG